MDSIGRYDIQEEIGQGGMSVVYRGLDTTLQRPVAVKVLHEHLAKRDSSRQRFRREARAVARLDHDNIIDVYDFSDEDEKYSYIVMEYIPGNNLREFVDEHPAPPPEIVALIGAAVADALEHAHNHGVIHRDLKPENIMVTEDGRLTLMDFGIAHVADAETMTQTGSLLGSPAHMAPEIIDGKSVNEQSDVFSLGTVLYFLSTGEFPFRGDNPSHLLREIVEGNFEQPEAVEPKISRSLNDVIVKCLQREPDARPESVSSLRDQLLEGITALEIEDSPEDELRRYFNSPETYVADFEKRVVPRLVELGDQCAETSETSKAFHYYNRVLAYDPTNEEVTEALDDLHARQSSPYRTAAGVGVAVGMIAGVVGIFLFSDSASDSPIAKAEAAGGSAISQARRAAGAAASAKVIARDVVTKTKQDMGRLLARRYAHRILAQSAALHATAESESVQQVSNVPLPTNNRVAQVKKVPSSNEGARKTERDAGAAGAAESGSEVGAKRAAADTGTNQQPELYSYSFRILPLAATVFIDGKRYSVPAVHRGIELKRGMHRIRVESKGCRTYESTFRVDGPSEETRRIVLDWKDAIVTVESDVPAVVYIDGDRSEPVRIGADGEDAQIRIPFGKANAAGSQTRRKVALEVRPRDKMTRVREQTVTVRPGDSTSLTVNFRN